MTSIGETRIKTSVVAAAALLCALAPAAAQASGAADLFYERAVMSAAAQRCGLFAPDLSAALLAARSQARGAALRAGTDTARLASLQGEAERKASAVGCASPDMKTASARVRTAFEGYARLDRMTYPGQSANWKAERVLPSTGEAWRLSQASGFDGGQAIFGLAARRGQAGAPAVSVMFADGRNPYAARLVMRDGGRTSGPYLRGPSLAARLAPRSACRPVLAEGRTDSLQLSPAPNRAALVFRFPAAAAATLAALDPREAVAVDFLFSGPRGEVVRTAYFEVGDFAAGQAFASVVRR